MNLSLSISTLATSLLTSVAFAQSEVPVQTPGAVAQAGQPPAWTNLVMIGGMILLMWFFVIRPQVKRQKEHKSFLESLQIGVEVVTVSGMIGKITQITDAIVSVDFGQGSVRVLKSAISGKLEPKTIEAMALQKT